MNVERAKIGALFHDPPHKPWILSEHERAGKSFIQALVGELDENEWAAVRRADHLASGADRHAWLKDFTVNPREELEIVHPLDGRPILVPGSVTEKPWQLAITPEQIDALDKRFRELAEHLRPLGSDPKRLFLLLWRYTPELLQALEDSAGGSAQSRSRLGALWEILPADTRVPDHPVVVHNSLVAALTGLLLRKQGAAVLRVSLGPVQDFIASSRKLRDLWSASSLLAELVWQAMLPIVEELGPDHVIYPSLHFEPRFDRWLLSQLGLPTRPGQESTGEQSEEKGGNGKNGGDQIAARLRELGWTEPEKSPLLTVLQQAIDHLQRALLVPTLPNVFTALVPGGEAERFAALCAERARNWWKETARTLAKKAGNGDEYENRAVQQADALLEVFWSVVPWDLDADPQSWCASNGAWHRRPPLAEQGLKMARDISVSERVYRPNAGTLYADLFDQGEKLISAAKQERYAARQLREEQGLKCTVCGEREVLGPGDFWIQRTEGAQRRQDKASLKEGEQLCGVCTMKRHFVVAEIEDSPLARQPSTGEVAASAFKLAVVQVCAGTRWFGKQGVDLEGATQELCEAVKNFVDAAKSLPELERHVYCAPLLDMAARDSGEAYLEDFARIDGQYLLPFPREDEEVEISGALAGPAKQVRKAAQKARIAPPRAYLAVVVFDGDELGKWLSGTHERFPELKASLHSRVRSELEREYPHLQQKLAVRRPVTPAFHAALSAAAASFSRFAAPQTIEGEEIPANEGETIPGHLVYAGGDDVLFLAPVPQALELVLRLRRRFSGYPRRFGQEHVGDSAPWIAARLGRRGLVRPVANSAEAERIGMAFGGNATASAGMCVFHYRWPLESALRAARAVLEEAKDHGRNRLGIVIQRRSGSVSKGFLPFPVGPAGASGAEGNAFAAFQKLLQAFQDRNQDRKVSPRLASLFRAELAPLLGAHPWQRPPSDAGTDAQALREIAKTVAKRVARRRELGNQNALAVEELLLALGDALLGAGEEPGASVQQVERRILDWSELVTVAAFLAREGEE